MMQSGIPCRRGSSIPLMNRNKPRILAVVSFTNRQASIRRPIINEYDLVISKRLAPYAIEALAKVLFRIVHRDNDRKKRSCHSYFFLSPRIIHPAAIECMLVERNNIHTTIQNQIQSKGQN